MRHPEKCPHDPRKRILSVSPYLCENLRKKGSRQGSGCEATSQSPYDSCAYGRREDGSRGVRVTDRWRDLMESGSASPTRARGHPATTGLRRTKVDRLPTLLTSTWLAVPRSLQNGLPLRLRRIHKSLQSFHMPLDSLAWREAEITTNKGDSLLFGKRGVRLVRKPPNGSFLSLGPLGARSHPLVLEPTGFLGVHVLIMAWASRKVYGARSPSLRRGPFSSASRRS